MVLISSSALSVSNTNRKPAAFNNTPTMTRARPVTTKGINAIYSSVFLTIPISKCN